MSLAQQVTLTAMSVSARTSRRQNASVPSSNRPTTSIRAMQVGTAPLCRRTLEDANEGGDDPAEPFGVNSGFRFVTIAVVEDEQPHLPIREQVQRLGVGAWTRPCREPTDLCPAEPVNLRLVGEQRETARPVKYVTVDLGVRADLAAEWALKRR